MSAAIDAALTEMDARARALLRRLHERDKARGWTSEPIAWPGRSPRREPGEIWRQNSPTNGPDFCGSDDGKGHNS